MRKLRNTKLNYFCDVVIEETTNMQCNFSWR